jgi:hypothetical protein
MAARSPRVKGEIVVTFSLDPAEHVWENSPTSRALVGLERIEGTRSPTGKPGARAAERRASLFLERQEGETPTGPPTRVSLSLDPLARTSSKRRGLCAEARLPAFAAFRPALDYAAAPDDVHEQRRPVLLDYSLVALPAFPDHASTPRIGRGNVTPTAMASASSFDSQRPVRMRLHDRPHSRPAPDPACGGPCPRGLSEWPPYLAVVLEPGSSTWSCAVKVGRLSQAVSDGRSGA